MFRSAVFTCLVASLALGFPSCGDDFSQSSQGFSCAPPAVWVKPLAGGGAVRVRAMAELPDGHFVVAGHFDGELAFAGSAGLVSLTSAGGDDAFIAVFEPTGLATGATRFGGIGDERIEALAVGADGTMVVAGSFAGRLELGAGDSKTELVARGASDTFLAWLTLDGKLVRAVALHERDVVVQGLAAQPDGSMIVAGTAWRTVASLRLPPRADLSLPPWTLGEGAEGAARPKIRTTPSPHYEPATPFPRPSRLDAQVAMTRAAAELRLPRGNPHRLPILDLEAEDLGWALPRADLFLARFAKNGARLEDLVAGGRGARSIDAFLALPGGAFAIAGRFNGQLTLGLAKVSPLRARGQSDEFVARFDAGARLEWAVSAGNVDESRAATALSAGPAGTLFVGSSSVYAEGDPAAAGPTRERLHLTRLDRDGRLLSTGVIADAPALRAFGLAPRVGGGVVMVAEYALELRVFFGKSYLPISAGGAEDAFVANIDASGNLETMMQISGPESESVDAILALRDGAHVVAGTFEGATRFGLDSGEPPLVAEGATDAFLMRLR